MFNPDAPPRKKRSLRAEPSEVYGFITDDGVPLRLTRYRGGRKGPVLLSHGLDISSSIFSLDTIDMNLVEFLYAPRYDVWLLDYRFSIALPTSELLASGDTVAQYDYPAAVSKVRTVTGVSAIQIIAHCVGSITLFMSLLASLQGVQSSVSSQVAAHYVVPTLTASKAELHLPEVLQTLGSIP
ncbi:MAG: hypothetical protein D6690_10320 [Nitrospirae bacterium]|nr:MAG: hypothetical protein D6690_10320 [Nitrospirota bacterium]